MLFFSYVGYPDQTERCDRTGKRNMEKKEKQNGRGKMKENDDIYMIYNRDRDAIQEIEKRKEG